MPENHGYEIPIVSENVHPTLGYFVSYIHDRIYNRNKNFLGVVVGETGSGKSYTAISMAKTIDPTFDESRVAFTTQEFLEILNGDIRTGQAIVFDESGTGLSSRSWYDKAQIWFNYILQTFRHRNLVVFFTLPNLGMLDKQSRELAHCIIECSSRGIIKSKNINNVKAKMVEINAQSGKAYYKFVRAKVNGFPYAIKFLQVRKPYIKLLRGYENKKSAFTKDLNKKVLEMVTVKKATDNLTDLQRAVYERVKRGMTTPEICKELKMSNGRVYAIREGLIAKGYNIERSSRKKVNNREERLSEPNFTEIIEEVKKE